MLCTSKATRYHLINSLCLRFYWLCYKYYSVYSYFVNCKYGGGAIFQTRPNRFVLRPWGKESSSPWTQANKRRLIVPLPVAHGESNPLDWYILYFPEKLLIIKLKSKTETRVQPRETAPEIRIQESREVDREVVYLNPETAHKNEDLTHSYCEVDKSRSP